MRHSELELLIWQTISKIQIPADIREKARQLRETRQALETVDKMSMSKELRSKLVENVKNRHKNKDLWSRLEKSDIKDCSCCFRTDMTIADIHSPVEWPDMNGIMVQCKHCETSLIIEEEEI